MPMDTLLHLVALLFSLGILGLGFLVRRLCGTWASPAALFCLFWFLFSFLPLLGLFYVPVNPLGIAYILLCCVAFSLPAALTNWRPFLAANAKNSLRRPDYLATQFLWNVFHASFIISVLFLLLDLLVQGFSWQEVLLNFFVSSNSYLAKRYEGEIVVNPFGQWGLISGYLCVTVGGLLHAHLRNPLRRQLVLVAAMAPPTLIMLVQAAKGLFFLAIALILAGHMIKRILANDEPFVDLSKLARQLKYGIFAAPLIIISFLTRGLFETDDSQELFERITAYLASYAFMHVYAFSDWFAATLGEASTQAYNREDKSWGYFTFIALFKLLGSAEEVPAGVYDEYFTFGNLSPGNIYTIFRGLITDFGFLGAPVVLFLAGTIFNFGFKQFLATKHPAISVAVIFVFVHFLYTSYIISAFIWNTTYLVAVLMAVVFYVNKLLYRRPV
jgi:oligosaccharide repeat unit polymerase